ncbi:MAG TPA: hypothetical protein VG321_03000, partial [Solirubrobacteraceae bacterium]|nr:hypothetical protein [Solirubrobacteraceae bacterium]
AEAVLLDLSPILTDTSLCPKQAAASSAAYSLEKAGKLPKADRNTNMSGAKAILSKLPTS